MKRIIWTLTILILTSCSLFAQASVDEYDGFDWVRWDRGYKVSFVSGYTSALAAFGLSMAMRDLDFDAISYFTYFPGTMFDLVDEVDRYYEDYQNRSRYLCLVIMICTGLYDRWFPEGVKRGKD